LKVSHGKAHLPATAHFWSSCTSHTQLFFKSIIPIKNLQGLQHFLACTRTSCWLFAQTETLRWTAWVHLYLSNSSTQQTHCTVQPLPTHLHKGFRQHSHTSTHLNISPRFQELFCHSEYIIK
jgi:hypothetical protein